MSNNRTIDGYSSGKSLRILLVEDHCDTLQTLSNLLTHFGHEISVADDAESARKIIGSKANQPKPDAHTFLAVSGLRNQTIRSRREWN